MKKLSSVLAMIFTLIVLLPNMASAAGKITETPDDQFAIQGKLVKFSTAVLTVDGEKLVPYKELLTGLGVKNDNKHMEWNAKQKSLTIVSEPVKLVLKVGSLTAQLNDKPVKMKVAPVVYKKTAYVPAKFVSESLNYKYVADPVSRTYYIRDAQSFENMKTLLGNAIQAMTAVEKVKGTQSAKLSITANGGKYYFESGLKTEMDAKSKVEVVAYSRLQNILGKETKYAAQICIANNKSYSKDSTDTAWNSQPMTEKEFQENFLFDLLSVTDVYCAGFVSQEIQGKNQILIKGPVNLKSYLEDYLKSEGIEKYVPSQVSAEITLDAATHCITKIYLKAVFKTVSIPAASSCTVELTNQYSDFNGAFEVALPEGIPAPEPAPVPAPIPAE